MPVTLVAGDDAGPRLERTLTEPEHRPDAAVTARRPWCRRRTSTSHEGARHVSSPHHLTRRRLAGAVIAVPVVGLTTLSTRRPPTRPPRRLRMPVRRRLGPAPRRPPGGHQGRRGPAGRREAGRDPRRSAQDALAGEYGDRVAAGRRADPGPSRQGLRPAAGGPPGRPRGAQGAAGRREGRRRQGDPGRTRWPASTATRCRSSPRGCRSAATTCAACSESLARGHIGVGEVVALEEQRLTGHLGQGIGHAVAEVELRLRARTACRSVTYASRATAGLGRCRKRPT